MLLPDSRKLRGLFIIEVENVFDEKHPLWEVIEGLRDYLEEIHVAIFTSGKVQLEKQIIEKDNKFIYYYFNKRFPILTFSEAISVLKFNLTWRGVLRADFIVSFNEGIGSLVGLRLSKRYKRVFIQRASVRSIGFGRTTLRYLLTKYLFENSTGILIPGPETGSILTETFTLPPANLFTLIPPISVHRLEDAKNPYNFNIDYPQYNFFLSAMVYDKATLLLLSIMYKKITVRYPRAGLVIFVDPQNQYLIQKYLKKNKIYGILVYPQNDRLYSYIQGSSVYLAVNKEKDVDTNMLAALGLQVPVVANSYGLAKDIFAGTPYAGFLTDVNDTNLFSQAVIKLIEDQRLRKEYAINSRMLLSKITFDTPQIYAEKLMKIIEEIVRPLIAPVKNKEEI